LIKVGHLAAPVGSNGGFDVVDDATAPHVRLFKRDLSRAFNQGIVRYMGAIAVIVLAHRCLKILLRIEQRSAL
jgi:hypothetical protein